MKLKYLLPAFVLFCLCLAGAAQAGSGQVHADEPTPTPPTATPTPAPFVLNINPATRALTCGATMQVQVSVTQNGAAAADGTSVQLATSLGVVTPTTTTTAGGNAFFTYIAPQGANGTPSLTATAGTASNSTGITVFCGSASPPAGLPFQPAVLGTPVVTCLGASASVTFVWTPAPGLISQPGTNFAYLDLTLQNNGFLPGTFLSAGPLDVTTSQILWNGILPGATTFWRINTFNGSTWQPSTTGSFVPCGTQAPPAAAGTVTYSCTAPGLATVTFNFGAVPNGVTNWLDITLFNNGFQPGTFIGMPISGQASAQWSGILGNVPTYWRLNSLLPGGWTQVTGGTFVAQC